MEIRPKITLLFIAVSLTSCAGHSMIMDVIEKEELVVEGAAMMAGLSRPVQYRIEGRLPQFDECDVVFYIDSDLGKLRVQGRGFPDFVKHLYKKYRFSLRRNPDRRTYDIVKVMKDGEVIWKE